MPGSLQCQGLLSFLYIPGAVLLVIGSSTLKTSAVIPRRSSRFSRAFKQGPSSFQEDRILLGRTSLTHALLAGRRRPTLAETVKGAVLSERRDFGDSWLHGLLGLVSKTFDEMGSAGFWDPRQPDLFVCLPRVAFRRELRSMCTVVWHSHILVIPDYSRLRCILYIALCEARGIQGVPRVRQHEEGLMIHGS